MEAFPNENFQKVKGKNHLSLFDIFHSVQGMWPYIWKIVLISFVLEIFSMISPLYIQFITDNVIISHDKEFLYVIAVGFSLLAITRIVISYTRSWITLYFTNNLNLQMKINVINHLIRLPLDFFEKRH